jgi:predicted O-methyltransferase YrrM
MRPELVAIRLGANHIKGAYDQGKICYELITEHRLSRCLQIGFRKGVSSALIAAALEDIGGGSLLAVERQQFSSSEPDIHEVLNQLGLSSFVDVRFEPRCFNWHMMKLLESGAHETFDFCYIDGQRTWEIDGFAYCLVSRLIRKGGWLVINHLDWTFESSLDSPWAKAMPTEELLTAQVGKVFEFLMQKDAFWRCSLLLEGKLGVGQKTDSIWSARKDVLEVRAVS